jgi:hypothetical protein
MKIGLDMGSTLYNPDILNQGTGFFCLCCDMSKWENSVLQHFGEPVNGTALDARPVPSSLCVGALIRRSADQAGQ